MVHTLVAVKTPIAALHGADHRFAITALRAALLGAGLAVAALPTVLHAQAAAAQARQAYDIPAGPLAPSLYRLASEAGITLAFDPALAEGRQAPALDGAFTASEALERLLYGSGLRAVAGNNGGYRLEAAPEGAMALPPVRVEAAARQDPTKTEGTGAYAPRASRTATKLTLTPRETPQSVSVLTRQQIDDLGVTSVNEALERMTGVYTANNDTERTTVFSRGYALNNYQVDGLLSVQGDGYVRLNSDSAIFDRVEVVRGAAGLVAGAGDPSGVISLWRKRPGEEFAASITGLLGRWDNRRIELDVGGPIAFDGKLRARAVAVKQKSESFRDYYETDKTVFYGVVEAHLTDSTVLAVGYDYEEPDASGVTWGTVPYWMADGSVANLPRSTSFAPRWASWPIRQKQAFATFDHDFGNGWSLKAGYTDDSKDGTGKLWYGGSGYPAADGTGIGAWSFLSIVDLKTTTFDVNVNGLFDLFGREHEIVFGYGEIDSTMAAPAFSYDADPYEGYLTIPDWRNWDPNIPEYDITYLGYNASETDTVQKGAYAALRLQLADPLKLIIGSRLSDYERRSRNYGDDGSLSNASGYDVSNELTPYFGLIYNITEKMSAYASYTDIFSPQNRKDVSNEFIDPIVGSIIEGGVKVELFDDRLLASAAVFGGKQDNLAEIDTSLDLEPGSFDPQNPPDGYNNTGRWLLPDGSTPYKSTGKGNKVQGYELDIQGAIVDDWNVSLGFSHTKIENAQGMQTQTTVPKDLLRLFTTYKLPGALSRLTVGGGVSWQSDIWRNANRPTGELNANGAPITQSTRMEQGSLALVNAMARYRFSEQLSASVNVNNLFDKHYYRQIGFYNGVHWGDPLSWTARVQYSF